MQYTRHSQPLQFQKTDRNRINNIDLQLIDRHQSTSLCRTNQELRLPAYPEFPKRTMISGRRIFFFLPSPSPLSFFRPRTYRKGYYFNSPQSSTVIKSKMAATTILRTRTRFRPPKIRLHCRLLIPGPNIEIDRQSKSRRHDHSFPEGIISHWGRGLFYDFKILLVVAILAQAFHITLQYVFFKFAASVVCYTAVFSVVTQRSLKTAVQQTIASVTRRGKSP